MLVVWTAGYRCMSMAKQRFATMQSHIIDIIPQSHASTGEGARQAAQKFYLHTTNSFLAERSPCFVVQRSLSWMHAYCETTSKVVTGLHLHWCEMLCRHAPPDGRVPRLLAAAACVRVRACERRTDQRCCCSACVPPVQPHSPYSEQQAPAKFKCA